MVNIPWFFLHAKTNWPGRSAHKYRVSHAWSDARMGGQMDGWMDRWMDRWINGPLDGCTHRPMDQTNDNQMEVRGARTTDNTDNRGS